MLNLNQFLIEYYKINPSLFILFDLLRDILIFFQIFLVLFTFLFSKKKLIFVYLLFFLLAFLISQFFSYFFPSLRPITYYFNQPYLTDSFPSKHTFLSTVSSLFIFNYNPFLGIISFITTIFIALFSYLSLMHWPIDIFSGLLLGIVLYFLLKKLLNFFFRLDI